MSSTPSMKALLLALLLGGCAGDEDSAEGGGPVISSSAPEAPEDDGRYVGTGEDPGMCSLYGTIDGHVGLGGGMVDVPIPVMCDPYAPYTGYPPDVEGPEQPDFDFLLDQNEFRSGSP